MRQRVALDLFSNFKSLKSRGCFGEPLGQVVTPRVSRQSNVAIQKKTQHCVEVLKCSLMFCMISQRKPQKTAEVVYRTSVSLDRTRVSPDRTHKEIANKKTKRSDLSILVWNWRSKKTRRTAPMRSSWKSTVAVMQKKPCQEAALSQSTV